MCLKHYWALYILNNESDVVFGKIVIPLIKIFLMMSFILCFFTCFRLWKYISFLPLALIILLLWTSFLILVPVTMILSRIFDLSTKFRRNLKCVIHHVPQNKLFLRQLRACPLIRCHVGGLYYMESRAKLTTIQKLVNGVRFLLVNVTVWMNMVPIHTMIHSTCLNNFCLIMRYLYLS